MKKLARVYWPCYLLAQLFFARWTRIDFYDAFANLRNARALAGAPIGYTTYRPPLPPLMHAPLQLLLSALDAGLRARVWAPHLFQVVVSLACLGVVYLYLKRFLPENWAQAGTILFSLDRLTVHYFFAVMADIPAALFLVAAFLMWEKKTRASAALCAVALAAGVLSRWNMLLVPGLMLLAAPLLGSRRLAAIAASSLLLSWFVCALAYHRALGVGLEAATRILSATLFQQADANSGRETPLAYLAMLFTCAGPAVCALFAAGTWFAWRDRKKDLLLQAAAFAVFFLVMTFGVGHKESRYLYPVLPAVYLLAVFGLKRLDKKWAIAVVAAIAVFNAGSEWARFFDPAYRSTAVTDAAAEVLRLRGPGGRVYWKGFARSLAPSDPVFTRSDAYYYLYHVPSVQSTEYLTGAWIKPLEAGDELVPGDLVVSAPSVIARIDRPIPAADNRLSLWRVAPPK